MKYLTLILFLISSLCLSQNLIRNGDFEDGSPMNNIAENLDSVEYWKGYGSPDYYSVNSPYPASTFNNYFGFQLPHSGNNYCGFFAGKLGAPKLYELIYTDIKSPLIKDSIYYLNFYISLGDYMSHRANSIGILIVEQPFFEIQDMNGMGTFWMDKDPIDPILISDSTFLKNDKEWISIELTYKAKGGEQYLFIGGFDNKKKSNTQLRTRTHIPKLDAYVGHSYYFIDDVTLTRQKPKPDSVTKSLVCLEKLTFLNNSSKLTENSISIIKPLIDYCKITNPKEIVITGYTDSTGNSNLNKKLSIARAKTVANYIISQGMSENMISTFGGDNEHINSSRRVDIEIKK